LYYATSTAALSAFSTIAATVASTSEVARTS
jgi:hypothetical protein